ncbi:MAG TPA: lanthionine synthetase LanC family protein [Kofleriaceae bacterium]|nr:lanthionine synthetase LanC family protein [Kofleriaceae bacterium]
MLIPHLQAPHLAGAAWQPLLDGGERDRALELVWQIGKAVRDWQEAPSAPTLLGGAGIAVFCAYGEAAGVLERVDVAGMLAGCVARAGEAGLPVGLWNGCAGLRWAIAHLAEGDAAAAITARLDAAIALALESAPADMAFDLYSGLAGVLLAYADDDSPAGRGIVQAVLDRLAAIDWANARPTAGCAHGVAGVVAALAGVASARPALADPARRLLRALVRQVRHDWMYHFHNSLDDSTGLYAIVREM